MELTLVEISEHLSRIARFLAVDATFGSDEDLDDRDHHDAEEFWNSVLTPIEIAAHIRSIEVHNNVMASASYYWCDGAYEADRMREDLLSCYIQHVTRFMWIWVAFEKLIDLVCGEPNVSRTKMAIRYLKDCGFTPRFSPIDETTWVAMRLAPRDVARSALATISKTSEFEFSYIHLCRELRNYFLHQQSQSIVPEEREDEKDYIPENDTIIVLTKSASRLTLYAIQELIFNYLKKSKYKTAQFMDAAGIPKGIPIAEAIRGVHLEKIADYGFGYDSEEFDEPNDQLFFKF